MVFFYQITMVHTPQENGRVERKHRYILKMAHALLFQANLPIRFWEECFLTVEYFINRTPSSVLDRKTPFEFLFNKILSYSHIQSFEYLAYIHDNWVPKNKFCSWGRKCVFLGYSYGKKGWKLFDLDTHDILCSRNVVFLKSIFPYSSGTQHSSPFPMALPYNFGELPYPSKSTSKLAAARGSPRPIDDWFRPIPLPSYVGNC